MPDPAVEPVRGRVRPVEPGMAVQGFIWPDENAVSFLLSVTDDATGEEANVELSHGELTALVGAALGCGSATVTHARKSLKIRDATRVGAPAHLRQHESRIEGTT